MRNKRESNRDIYGSWCCRMLWNRNVVKPHHRKVASAPSCATDCASSLLPINLELIQGLQFVSQPSAVSLGTLNLKHTCKRLLEHALCNVPQAIVRIKSPEMPRNFPALAYLLFLTYRDSLLANRTTNAASRLEFSDNFDMCLEIAIPGSSRTVREHLLDLFERLPHGL